MNKSSLKWSSKTLVLSALSLIASSGSSWATQTFEISLDHGFASGVREIPMRERPHLEYAYPQGQSEVHVRSYACQDTTVTDVKIQGNVLSFLVAPTARCQPGIITRTTNLGFFGKQVLQLQFNDTQGSVVVPAKIVSVELPTQMFASVHRVDGTKVEVEFERETLANIIAKARPFISSALQDGPGSNPLNGLVCGDYCGVEPTALHNSLKERSFVVSSFVESAVGILEASLSDKFVVVTSSDISFLNPDAEKVEIYQSGLRHLAKVTKEAAETAKAADGVAQFGCHTGWCWKYVVPGSQVGAPWCYTQKLGVSAPSAAWAACTVDSDCSLDMTCGDSKRYSGGTLIE